MQPSMIRPKILGRIAWLFVMLLSKSVRVCFVNRRPVDRLVSKDSVIYAFFHGDMIPLLYAYRNSGILIPASESRDGEIMAQVLKNFGFDAARGSSKRNGHKALLELISGMRKGKTVAISVDGPRGPLHDVKPGVIYLAGLLKKPIIPIGISAQRFQVIEKSWDRLLVPAPFTKAVVIYGDPFYVHDTSSDTIQSCQKRLQAEMERLKFEAGKNRCEEWTGSQRSTAPIAM